MPDLTPADVLGPGGLIAAKLPAYESRPQQLAMADLVAQAVGEAKHLIVEAPTGVGKSFAYLVPVVLHALKTGRKVVISTNTIALQEQLVAKDIPLVQQIFPELKAVLVKGRQNYLSLRRLSYAANGQQALFDSREDAHALKELLDWSAETEVGDLADLGFDPPPQVWRLAQSDRNNCLGRKCPTYEQCFFYKARREMETAHLLVVNHHLYFSDLSLRDEHAAILPAHDVVVFDEAHTLEDVATDHLGASISEAQVRYYLDGLWSRKGKGLFAQEPYAAAREAVEHARLANEDFWKRVALLAIDTRQDTVKLTAPGMVDNPLSPALDAVAQALDQCRARASDDNAVQELRAQQDRAAVIAGGLRQVVEQQLSGHVYYAHLPTGRGSPSLSASPLSVAELLKTKLFAEMKSVVLTSATLAADDSDRFLFLRRRIGLEDGLGRRLDSPFDYQAQAKLLLNSSPIDPNSPRFEHALSAWLSEYLALADGGVFVLFTSYRQLQAVHDLVRPTLDRANRFVLRHGDGMGRAQMLDLFKRVGNAVLFGTSSFWEGVDVPGDALKHVIITKLPFEVPNHPVVEARHADIKKRGGNPFMERTVPEAIIRLKQGFGRLIRTKSDTGTVAICDHRVLTAAYGRYFLRALPACATEMFQLERYLTAEV
jgi:ATP-dependent DNA helicase DinG